MPSCRASPSALAPECRIVYVDNDPLVLVHARALLTSSPEGVTDYLDADLHDPDTILRQAAKTLDFTQPIALMLLGIINHIMDTDEAYAIQELIRFFDHLELLEPGVVSVSRWRPDIGTVLRPRY